MDNETIQWSSNNDHTWHVNTLNETTQTFEEMLTTKWDTMVKDTTNGKCHKVNGHDQIAHSNKIRICTDKVQSDTGANQAVTNNKESLYAYSDIDPYPVGGVKADDVAIICTGHGLLPWQSTEGHIIMVRTMYCDEVDGTIISPTTVVQQNQDTYQGFTIDSDCDIGTGTL